MPVLVRNKQEGPTVFQDDVSKVRLEWFGAGDPSGNDVQYVPDTLLTNPDFAKAVRRGIFEVETEEQAEQSLAQQTESYQQRTSEAAKSATAAMDQQVNNDLVQATCIGPSTRGTGECGEPVPVREKAMKEGDAPVLCARHSSLAGQYTQVETGVMIERGDSLVSEKKWVRATVTPRESTKQ